MKTKTELYLAKIAGEEVTLPTPVTNVEFYLAKLAGMNVDLPAPTNGKERALYAVAENGGSGGEVTPETDISESIVDRSITSYTAVGTVIGASAFKQCNKLDSVDLTTVEEIGDEAFRNTALTSVTMSSKLTKIGQGAFYACWKLTSFEMPDSVTTLGGGSIFASCTKLKSIKLSSNIATLTESMFYKCSALESIDIPASVTLISNTCFSNCSKLDTMIVRATTPPTAYSTAISGMKSTCAIYVPAESVDLYKAANNWSARASYIQAIPE